jgi:ATP-binding cassette, subfamily B, bacterial MsbA
MNPGHRDTLRRLRRYARPHALGMAVAIGVFLLAAATEPLIPALLQVALDKGFATQASFPLWSVPLALIGLFVLRGLLGFVGTYLINRASSLTVLDIRRDLARALTRADAALFNRMPPGLAVAKVVNDPQVMAGQLSGAALTLLRDGTTAMALLAYLFWVNWQLTLLSLAVVPLMAWGVRLVHRRVNKVGTAAYEAQMRLVAVVDDLARSWRVIRTFDAAEFEHKRLDGAARAVQRGAVKSSAAAATMTPMSQTIASLGVALIVTMALYQGRSGITTVGEFAGYIAALLLLVSKLRHLTDVSQPILGALITAKGCFELLDWPPERDQGEHDPGLGRGSVCFRDVQLFYPGSAAPALRGLSLEMRPGTTVALVGASGAGKSTVVNALLGFVDVAQGSLTLDEVPLADWRKAALRRQFAVVSQDIVLFDASVADNVVYAALPDRDRVERCLRDAALWDTVCALPGGLDAPIGVNGSRLSGGQRQRLAIARALYKDAPVWIFDEATSSLDSDSEAVIQQALKRWHGRKTMLLIAHRLSTVRHADTIYVLQAGRVLEHGSHAQLMQLGGAYARTVQLQGSGQALPV